MGLFSFGYEPGGEYHVSITDDAFVEAQELFKDDDEIRKHFAKLVAEKDCSQYEAHDLPVTEIIGSFFLAYEIQEEKDGLSERLRIGNIQLGRKDLVKYNQFVQKYNDRLKSKAERKQAAWESKNTGEQLASMAAGAAFKGLARVVTGKSGDIRDFERSFANYICGTSEKARNYLLDYAKSFGAFDDGVSAVARAIRDEFWLLEFARYNRAQDPSFQVMTKENKNPYELKRQSKTESVQPELPENAGAVHTELICTNPDCRRDIPPDSIYCGYCGTRVA